MEAYFSEVERIMNTLPIGYYAGCRVPVELDREGNSSYMDLLERKIVISYPLIAQGVKDADEGTVNLETAVRSMLYHEVGHAIMTPPTMKVTQIRNIFEDERLETILQDFFMDVDFKGNIKRICGWVDGAPHGCPKDAMEAFFWAVRYRYGKKEWLDRVHQIIMSNRYITSTDYNDYNVRYYCREIERLYELIAAEYGSVEYPEGGDNPNSEGEGEGDSVNTSTTGSGNNGENADNSGSESSMNSDLKSGDKAQQPQQQDGGSMAGRGSSCSGSGNNDPSSYIDRATEGSNKFDDMEHWDKENLKYIAAKAMEKMANINTAFYNKEVVDGVTRIIESFNRKTGGGSAYQTYSGVINPKLIGRADYRFFERQAAERGTNKFGSVHLNLFLDYSGSFHRNQDAANELIFALVQLERHNKNFTFDICYCGESEYIATKQQRVMRCSGGNCLDEKIFDIFRKLQKPNTYNYNIVLFDGDAFSDSWNRKRDERNFSAFNKSNCTIISDFENAGPITKYAASARHIFTKDYVNELHKNVLNALSFAFH